MGVHGYTQNGDMQSPYVERSLVGYGLSQILHCLSQVEIAEQLD